MPGAIGCRGASWSEQLDGKELRGVLGSATGTQKQPIMRIEDRLFDTGWARSAMATRKCGNIYFRKYFMAVRKFTNIFVLLLILMVGSRDTLFLVCFT